MASLELWLEGDMRAESAVFTQDLMLDVDRLQYDEVYATRVAAHIRNGLQYLAKEIEALGLAYRENLDAEGAYWHDYGGREWHEAG